MNSRSKSPLRVVAALLVVSALALPTVAASALPFNPTHEQCCGELAAKQGSTKSTAVFSGANERVELAKKAKKKYVYITRTGKKYHKNGCRYLKKSKKKIELKKAKKLHYKPCKICKPPKK